MPGNAWFHAFTQLESSDESSLSARQARHHGPRRARPGGRKSICEGFQRWVEHCMEAAKVRGLNSLDILVLHAVNHRARGRRLAEICMVLNIDDTHLVAYALKKLAAANLVRVEPKGRERHFRTTDTGESACIAHRVVRENFLVPSLSWSGCRDTVRESAGFLRTMTALYEQAGRFATAESAAQPRSLPVDTKR